MRPILLLVLICLTYAIHAADDATPTKKKITHHVQFLIGNYVSQVAESVHNSPYGQSIAPYTSNAIGVYKRFYGWGTFPVPSFLYSYSLGFDYQVEFSERYGLRTGVNYYTYGANITLAATDDELNVLYLKEYLFTSSLHVPAHLMIFKKKSKGRIIFTLGPDLYLPINSFGRETSTNIYSDNLPDYRFHSHSSGTGFFQNGSLGFTAGIGYEKKFIKGTTVEFMPDFRLLNAVPFDFNGAGVHVYNNYIFNMALGLSTYITFY